MRRPGGFCLGCGQGRGECQCEAFGTMPEWQDCPTCEDALRELQIRAENAKDRTDEYGKGLRQGLLSGVELLKPDDEVTRLIREAVKRG